MKLRHVATLCACLAAGVPAASGNPTDPDLPPAGSYGFNWLDPDSQCRQLTEEDLARVEECTVSTNAFGLDLASHACKVDADTELMVYETEAQCQQALETMQANGP
jgi:hypothetical protein